MLIIIMVVLFFAVGLGYMFEDEEVKTFIGTWLLLSLIIFAVCLPFSYYVSGDNMSKLEIEYKINIENSKKLTEIINERASLDNKLPNAIVDAPNMGQSQKASEIILSYTNQINNFNESLRSARYHRSVPTVWRFIFFGVLVPLPEGINYIRLN